MKRSPEEKLANQFEDAVTRTSWNPVEFAHHVLRLDGPSQWRMLWTIVHVLKAWKRDTYQSPQEFNDLIDADPDLTETIDYVTEAEKT